LAQQKAFHQQLLQRRFGLCSEYGGDHYILFFCVEIEPVAEGFEEQRLELDEDVGDDEKWVTGRS
jgi:hypothetical protein